MPPLPVERSLSLTDVEALSTRRTTPFDLSVAVGYGDKKNIFKIARPKRERHKSVGLFSVSKYIDVIELA